MQHDLSSHHHGGQKVALQLDDLGPFRTDKSGPILSVHLPRVSGEENPLV